MKTFSIGTTLLIASVLAAGATVTIPALAQNKEHEGADRQGYVLKPGEGETLGPNRIIKASPESGTQGGVMVLDRLPPGFTTGPHMHRNADEFFYMISGTGRLRWAGEGPRSGPAMSYSCPLEANTRCQSARSKKWSFYTFWISRA